MRKDIAALLTINPNDNGGYEIIHCEKGLIATCPTEELATKVSLALTYLRKAQASHADRWVDQFCDMIAGLPKGKRKIALHHLDNLLERIAIWKEQARPNDEVNHESK